ncbi:hypothetical protein BCR39DRAFT_534828 [Naematelia encephala]|uniref:Mtf2-like C-terminal domain-containing protein n=1 Tax=Naematelia encephala TaxID=71784 RepID=A0A1Y2B0Y2_9TREE|nr:hypothetical protein BCR39DRAFT_534828 [Naematelia encephala]
MPDVPIRQRKGVHSRIRRAEGQTPAEAQTFNTILSEIFSDLERSGPLRAGSSASSNVFGLKSNQSSNYQPKIWGGDRAALRRQGLMERHTKDTDETLLDEIDRLKEDMSHIDSDSVLLTWSKLHVFNPTIDAYGDPQFPSTYQPLLAHLLHVVRINLNRPHLALALFHYAQSHSPESYLTGCLAPAYNEILHVRWESFRDLAGIDQGVQEMDVNGVRWDIGTRQVVSRVVNDVLASPQAYGVGALDVVNRLEKRIEQDLDEQKDVYQLMRGSSKARLPLPVAQAPITVTTADISQFVP